ncbi:MAG: EAL domain-containing protein, partial [Pseudomonadota bacterium]
DELKAAHRRLATIAKVAPVGLYELCKTPEGQSHFPFFNDRFLEFAGAISEDQEGREKAAFNLVLPADRPGTRAALDASALTLQPFKRRFSTLQSDGSLKWLNVVSEPRRHGDGSVVWTGAVLDITADVEREDALREARVKAEQIQAENEWHALHDGLTSLPNRRYFDQSFAERLSAAEQDGPKDVILIRLDLDHFKHVNDTLGHEAGDMVLVRVADVLRACSRIGDFAARIGGDEFSILMAPGTPEDEARQVIARMRAKLEEPFHYNGRLCRYGSSFGMAMTDDVAKTRDDLHLFADTALYRAKDLGRNQLQLFTPGMHRELVRGRSLAQEIHNALETQQFEPYFQPQISATTGDLVGAEVLLRWNHPTYGVLAPGDFMQVATQLGVVADLDRIMMEETKDVLHRLMQRGIALPKVSLNVSSGRMHDPSVVEMAKSIAALDVKVAFELLESILIEAESDVFRFHLDLLREAGVEIEIDDFGSGHASILGVMESSATALKIDRRLISPLEHDELTQSLVRAIIEIAEALEIRTIAEGVETNAQREILRDLGCDVLQGYLFSKPIREAQLAEFVQSLRSDVA